MVARKICLVVELVNATWQVTSGCFKDGHTVLYQVAENDRIYQFRDLQVQIVLDGIANTIKQPASSPTGNL